MAPVRLLLALVGVALCAQTPFLPVSGIRPGMKGVGRTVFSGSRIDDFQVEILGVLENIGPRQSLILARLSGGPLAKTGVMQGMSGSPVYIDGKLIGAVAMSFQFSTEPIAAIRPIEEMVRDAHLAAAPRAAVRIAHETAGLTAALPKPQEIAAGGGRLIDIATPVSFSGFTRATLDHFAPQLRALGLEPSQGVSGGAPTQQPAATAARIKPGSMISVQLMTGDLSVGADGTVTHIDGNRIYAFGHRFLDVGETDLQFARSEVLALLPNLSSSFKISASRERLGALTVDRNTVVAGEIGRKAAMAPVEIVLTRPGARPVTERYRMELASDRTLAPFLFQMAVFSTIDATERALGAASFRVRGYADFGPTVPRAQISGVYSGDFAVPAQASLATALPVFYALQSGFTELKLRGARIEIEAFEQKRSALIDQVWASRATARPGDTIEFTIVMQRDNGGELLRQAKYVVPAGMTPGPLQFTVTDANTTNLMEYRALLTSQPKSSSQLVGLLNGLRSNDKAFIRVWRPDPVFQTQGDELPNPPASVALLLGRAQPSLGGTVIRGAKLAEIEVDAGGLAVTGTRTIQVEIKE